MPMTPGNMTPCKSSSSFAPQRGNRGNIIPRGNRENPLAKLVLKGEVSSGDSVPVDAKNGEITFKRLIH